MIGCKQQGTSPAAAATDPVALTQGNTEFAFDLYAEIRAQEGNLFLSPYSISSALAMTYAGARGNTASQMEEALHFGLGGESLHATFAAFTDSLNAEGKRGDFDLSVANALWGQEGFEFLEDFLALNVKYYGAGLNLVDFAGDAEGARKAINSWVEKETRDKIKELIKPGLLNRLTRLVLTNAIYFKGKWASQFDADKTRDEDFWPVPKRSVKVPMMHQTAEFGYMETDDLQVLELPYEGAALSMVVLLPKAAGLDTLEQALNADTLAAWLDGIREQKVIVSLPRFKVTAGLDLTGVLAGMGMADAFSSMAADFSGMTGGRDLYISAVVHKAFVDVNEEGTEAAAATGVVMTLTSAGPAHPIFRADHPFIFLIMDRESDSILFMGRLVDPEAE
jgi:serpin B